MGGGRRREVSAALGQTPRFDSSNGEGTSLAGRGDWQRVYPPSHPKQGRTIRRQTTFGAEVLGDARSTVVLASRSRLQRKREGSKTHPHRLRPGGIGRLAVRGESTMTASRGANLARCAPLGPASRQLCLRQKCRKAELLAGWVSLTEGAGVWWSSLGRGDYKATIPGGQAISLAGDRLCPTEVFRGESRGAFFARHVSRHPQSDGPATKKRPSGLAGTCLHPTKNGTGTSVLGPAGQSLRAEMPGTRSAAKRRLGSATSIAGSP
jgi:hypothetical protein